MTSKSTVYTHGTIVTINTKRQIILDGALHIVGNRIVAVAKTSILLSSSLPPDTITIDLKSCIVIPGLINAHAHLIQSLMRGLGEDLDLHCWACDAIWPLEASYQGDDGYVAAKLAMAEMLRSGTTCFLEPMLPIHAGFDGVAKAVEETGIRACLGTLVKASKANSRAGDNFVDARDGNAKDTSVQAALTTHGKYHGLYNDRLHVWIAAETPRGVDESIFTEIGAPCEKHNLHLTVHVAEDSRDKTLIKECYNATPVQFCQNNKLTSERTVLAHMIHLDLDTDLDILKATNTSVVHNPTSNCKLGDGVAAVPQMLEKGINVALGTDGAPCSNTYDLFRDMHLAGIIHKGVHQNAALLPAEQILEMATISGAKALGIEKQVGSLEVGKKADFVVLDVDDLRAAPFEAGQVLDGGVHVATTVVHSCDGSNVSMVVVDGVVVVENGKLMSVDEEEVKRRARETIVGIRKRSGVSAQPAKMGWTYA